MLNQCSKHRQGNDHTSRAPSASHASLRPYGGKPAPNRIAKYGGVPLSNTGSPQMGALMGCLGESCNRIVDYCKMSSDFHLFVFLMFLVSFIDSCGLHLSIRSSWHERWWIWICYMDCWGMGCLPINWSSPSGNNCWFAWTYCSESTNDDRYGYMAWLLDSLMMQILHDF